MTRAEAKQQGLRYYDPGKPCKYGHTAMYTTARGTCVECQRIANAKLENKVRRAVYATTAKGQASLRLAKQNYRASEHGRKAEKEYKTEYRSRENELARKRDPRVRRLSRTLYPRTKLSHIHPDDREKVRALYRAARLLGMVVDHIIPLDGLDVCGLHTLCNLQLLTPEQHNEKTTREAKLRQLFREQS